MDLSYDQAQMRAETNLGHGQRRVTIIQLSPLPGNGMILNYEGEIILCVEATLTQAEKQDVITWCRDTLPDAESLQPMAI